MGWGEETCFGSRRLGHNGGGGEGGEVDQLIRIAIEPGGEGGEQMSKMNGGRGSSVTSTIHFQIIIFHYNVAPAKLLVFS